MTASQPFTLSIEPVGGKAYQHGFHLGTDETIARQLAEEIYTHYRGNKAPNGVLTVALIRGKFWAVYDGSWNR